MKASLHHTKCSVLENISTTIGLLQQNEKSTQLRKTPSSETIFRFTELIYNVLKFLSPDTNFTSELIQSGQMDKMDKVNLYNFYL